MAALSDEKKEVPIPERDNRQFDIVIYGATGFTGSIVATEFVKRYATSKINFRFAIAGRNNEKLEKLQKELQSEYKEQLKNLNDFVSLSNTPQFLDDAENNDLLPQKQNFIDNLPILIADVANKDDLQKIVSSTKLVISCIGPYRIYGENVVELCAKSGTHYVDICGEPDFMERCAFEYYEIAKQNGCFIVSACGFDSIPSDMGVSFIDHFYRSNGCICSKINGYVTGQAPDGFSIHHTTLQAAVHGFSHASELRDLRKEIAKKDYRIERKQIQRSGQKQKVNKETYFWSKEVDKWSMLFPFADSAVVNNSQGITAALLHSQGVKTRTFPQYAAYLSFNGKMQIFQAISVAGVASCLLNFEWGKDLLLSYPSFMSMGVFSEEGPTKKQRKSQTFAVKFFAKGYSQMMCKKYNYESEQLSLLNPDFNIRASVSGTDAAYSGTCLILIECAITLLQEESRIKTGDIENMCPAIEGGVFTPSTVFQNTSLISRLNEAGIMFDIEMDDNNTDESPNQGFDEYKSGYDNVRNQENNATEDDDEDDDDGDMVAFVNKQQKENQDKLMDKNEDFELIDVIKDDDGDGDGNGNDGDNRKVEVEYDYDKFNDISDVPNPNN